MKPQGFYNLNLVHEEAAAKRLRVGLLHGRTGIPLFLLYLRGVERTSALRLHSSQDVESQILSATCEEDKAAWTLLLPFFECDGSSALVVAHPLSRNGVSMSDLIGVNNGFHHRTGVHTLITFSDVCDLVAVPQAPTLLSPDECFKFYEALFALSGSLSHFFYLVDLPKDIGVEEATERLKAFAYPDAAAYYPWIFHGRRVSPPSALIAAHIQWSDRSEGCAVNPANRPIPGGYTPSQDVGPAEIARALDGRLNILKSFANNEMRGWGAYTLADKLDFQNRSIATRRTLVGLKEALETLCEPFVLEPMRDDLPQQIEVTLDSSLRSMESIFCPDAKQPFDIRVGVKSTAASDALEVFCRFSLASSVDELNLSMGFST